MTTITITPKDSINKTISEAPEGPLTLIMEEGEWREKVFINRPDVTLISEKGAIISTDDYHGKERNGYVYNTGESASVTISAPSFSAIGVTFLNSFDWKSGKKWNEEHEEDKRDLQAVALRTSYGATNSFFRSCTFLGWQDTLYLDYGVSILEDCTIKGSVDFIFGAGTALFQGCDIVSRDTGYVTAPSTFSDERIGFVFHDSVFKSDSSVPDNSVFLARPWFPSGARNRNPMALFVDCSFASHISSSLWTDMKSRTISGEERINKGEDARFYVYSLEKETIKGEEVDSILKELKRRF